MSIEINGTLVKPIDPLYLKTAAIQSGARQFQSTWTCEVYANPEDDNSAIGKVEVILRTKPRCGTRRNGRAQHYRQPVARGHPTRLCRRNIHFMPHQDLVALAKEE